MVPGGGGGGGGASARGAAMPSTAATRTLKRRAYERTMPLRPRPSGWRHQRDAARGGRAICASAVVPAAARLMSLNMIAFLSGAIPTRRGQEPRGSSGAQCDCVRTTSLSPFVWAFLTGRPGPAGQVEPASTVDGPARFSNHRARRHVEGFSRLADAQPRDKPQRTTLAASGSSVSRREMCSSRARASEISFVARQIEHARDTLQPAATLGSTDPRIHRSRTPRPITASSCAPRSASLSARDRAA